MTQKLSYPDLHVRFTQIDPIIGTVYIVAENYLFFAIEKHKLFPFYCSLGVLLYVFGSVESLEFRLTISDSFKIPFIASANSMHGNYFQR